MVSTPIGAPPSNYVSPILQNVQTYPTKQSPPTIQSEVVLPTTPTLPNIQSGVPLVSPMPNLLIGTPNNQGHMFPILYSQSSIDTQPTSIYSEYIGNPYNNVVNQENVDVNITSTNRVNSQVPISNSEMQNNQSLDNVNSTELNTSIDEDVNSNSECNQQTANMFKSSNYFCSDSGNDFIPPGSEILFTSQQENRILCNSDLVQGNNIPVLSTINRDKPMN